MQSNFKFLAILNYFVKFGIASEFFLLNGKSVSFSQNCLFYVSIDYLLNLCFVSS